MRIVDGKPVYDTAADQPLRVFSGQARDVGACSFCTSQAGPIVVLEGPAARAGFCPACLHALRGFHIPGPLPTG